MDRPFDSMLLQRFMIRDLNTGQFYMISDDDGGGSAKTSGKITDIVGGRELSMDEFQRNLGLEALGLVSSRS